MIDQCLALGACKPPPPHPTPNRPTWKPPVVDVQTRGVGPPCLLEGVLLVGLSGLSRLGWDANCKAAMGRGPPSPVPVGSWAQPGRTGICGLSGSRQGFSGVRGTENHRKSRKLAKVGNHGIHGKSRKSRNCGSLSCLPLLLVLV